MREIKRLRAETDVTLGAGRLDPSASVWRRVGAALEAERAAVDAELGRVLSDAATPGTKAYRQRLRDRAAVAAMQGLLASADFNVEDAARWATRFADALVAALYPEEGSDE